MIRLQDSSFLTEVAVKITARAGYDSRSIFKRCNRFEFGVFLLLDSLPQSRLKNLVCPIFYPYLEENNWIHTFPKGISTMWNAISRCQDLNSSPCSFPTTITITPRVPHVCINRIWHNITYNSGYGIKPNKTNSTKKIQLKKPGEPTNFSFPDCIFYITSSILAASSGQFLETNQNKKSLQNTFSSCLRSKLVEKKEWIICRIIYLR